MDTRDGTINKLEEGRYQILFVRRLRKPIEKVWAALTIPERIADWFTDVRFIPELRMGAGVEIRFPNDEPPYEMTRGEVLALEPPRLLAYSWRDADDPGAIIRCELAPDGDGCILTFSETAVSAKARDAATKHLTGTAAGWHLFLDALEDAADGLHTPEDRARHRAILPKYEGQLAALG